MNKIQKIKKGVRRKEWAEQVRECQNSGLSVREWCQQNGINVYTYYRRLRKLRNELPDQAEECHPIVPVSVSSEISKTSPIEQTAKPVTAEPGGEYEHAGCWAHARRKFYDCIRQRYNF